MARGKNMMGGLGPIHFSARANCSYKNNKEARRLYAELKSLTHLISDEIMMSLYGISEIMMS